MAVGAFVRQLRFESNSTFPKVRSNDLMAFKLQVYGKDTPYTMAPEFKYKGTGGINHVASMASNFKYHKDDTPCGL